MSLRQPHRHNRDCLDSTVFLLSIRFSCCSSGWAMRCIFLHESSHGSDSYRDLGSRKYDAQQSRPRRALCARREFRSAKPRQLFRPVRLAAFGAGQQRNKTVSLCYRCSFHRHGGQHRLARAHHQQSASGNSESKRNYEKSISAAGKHSTRRVLAAAHALASGDRAANVTERIFRGSFITADCAGDRNQRNTPYGRESCASVPQSFGALACRDVRSELFLRCNAGRYPWTSHFRWDRQQFGGRPAISVATGA